MNCPFCGAGMERGELRFSGIDYRGFAALRDIEVSWMPQPKPDRRGKFRRDWDAARPLCARFGALGAGEILENIFLSDGGFYLQNAWYCGTCGMTVCVLNEAAPAEPAVRAEDLGKNDGTELPSPHSLCQRKRVDASEADNKPPWEL